MIDEEYFRNRGQMEQKHFLQAEHWIEHFQPKKILDVGCGMGQLVAAFAYSDVEAHGCDISVYAIDNCVRDAKGKLRVGDIKKIPFPDGFADLVIDYDILEHLNEDEIHSAISELKRVSSKWVLSSICMVGDPNYSRDPTHRTYKTRAWWEHQFTKQGMKIYPIPKQFLFSHQLVIAEIVASTK